MKFTSIISAAPIAITAFGTLAPAASAGDRGVAVEEGPRVLMVRDHRGDRNYRRHHEGRRDHLLGRRRGNFGMLPALADVADPSVVDRPGGPGEVSEDGLVGWP